MAKNVLTDNLSEPLNGATTAKIDINAGDGNLTIDRLTGGEQVLASGTLQYFENQGPPTRTLVSSNGQATLTLRGGGTGQPWFRFPWAACNGATEWQIHLNPTVSSDITAHSDGGNVKLNLAGMAVTRVSADTGGGNMDVVLPDNAADLERYRQDGRGQCYRRDRQRHHGEQHRQRQQRRGQRGRAHPERRGGSHSRYHRAGQGDRGPAVQQDRQEHVPVARLRRRRQ